MASAVGFDEEKTSDQSAFVWFVTILVLLTSILIHIVWKMLIMCYRRIVNEKINGNQVGNGLKYTRDAATQTLERHKCNEVIGPVYVTKSGERWHTALCGHIVGRPTKMLTPCCDCTRG